MSATIPDLWTLTWGRPHVDPDALAAALEREVDTTSDLDFRTRLLIRDSVHALGRCWGRAQVDEWLGRLASRQRIEEILRSDLGPVGFPSLGERVMKSVDPERVLEYLRTLGMRVNQPARLAIGGSIALLLAGRLSRPTEDIDVVDEVPADIRSQHELLANLAARFGLQLTHFQSHYLPAGWENRVHHLGAFGSLQVVLVDALDIFMSKLFSPRDKDLDDLRMLKGQWDKGRLTERLLDTTAALLAEPGLRKHAESNWYVLYGEPLPTRA
jgi:hypothetical protein